MKVLNLQNIKSQIIFFRSFRFILVETGEEGDGSRETGLPKKNQISQIKQFFSHFQPIILTQSIIILQAKPGLCSSLWVWGTDLLYCGLGSISILIRDFTWTCWLVQAEQHLVICSISRRNIQYLFKNDKGNDFNAFFFSMALPFYTWHLRIPPIALRGDTL